MKLSLFFRKTQRIMRFSLAILLVAFSLGMGLGVQPAGAATWNTVNPGFVGTSYTNKIAYGNGTWLLFSGSNFGKSTDGTTFEQHSSKTAFSCEVNKAMHVGTQWIAVCSNGKVYTLGDGLDPVDVTKWVERTTGKSSRLVSIATDGDTIVVVGSSGGTLLTSDDGHNWVDRSISNVTGFNDVTYGQGTFLAVGKALDNSNVIYASDDGETWNKVTTATPSKQLYGIAYGGAKFVAVGLTGYLYVSDDGESWIEKTPPTGTQSVSFATVSYGSGQFYVGGTSETILTSPDGSTFTTEISGGGVKSVTSITVANGKAIAAGSSGLLLSAAAVAPISSNASLSNLTVTPGNLTFNPGTPNYTVEVPYGTTTVTVTPTLQDTTATLKVNGTSKANGQATSVTLDADGSTGIPIVVTAQDSITTKTYTITVNEAAPSSNGYLSSLSIDGTPVSGFVKTNYSYSMEVPHGTGSIDVSWLLDDPGTQTLQTVIIDNVSQPLGPITGLSLTPGVPRMIEIYVKAQNGTITVYALTVTEKVALVNRADLLAKVTAINNENLLEADYTPASWNDLQNALTAAQTVLNNPNATQTQVDDALAALNTARDGLENTASPVDKSALQAKVTAVTAENLNPATYTATSWQTFQSALTTANAVLGNANATQADVNNTLATLINARQGLIPVSIPVVVDKSVLQLTLKTMNEENLEEAAYTPESWRSLQDAWTKANKVMADPSATQIEVDTAVSALREARDGLIEQGMEADKRKLQAKVDEITSENLLEEDYTKASWDTLQEALREANDVLDDPDATQDKADAALAALKKARHGLKKQADSTVDKSKLDKKVDEIHDEDLDEDDYTKSSWRALKKALRDAEEVLADPHATQDEVDDALAELKKARRALENADREKDRDRDREKDQNKDQENNSPGSFTGNVVIPQPSTPGANDEKNDQKGYMTGYTSGNFEPNRSVTRAELATILANTGMVKQAASVNGNFFDVADNHWAADAIKRANEAGLMNGYANGMFNPTGGVTREEMAIILFRYLGLGGGGMNSTFSDVPADHWSTQMIAAVSQAGLMSGYPDGTFHPEKVLTRAEIVTILNRLLSENQLNHVNGQTWPDVPPTHWAFKDIEAATKK